MKTLFAAMFSLAFAATCLADIQDPPMADHGPTRKLGRGLSNIAFGWSEIPSTIGKINNREGNNAAAGYGVVRGVGRSFARFGVGFYEAVTFPFPTSKGTYMPVLRSDIPWIHRGYQEFPPELGFETKYPYVRDYSSGY
jgi:putative exosortase-associated protein (TIGR04073 family)